MRKARFKKFIRNLVPNFFICKGGNEKVRLHAANLTNS
jgi:hypothetical protein